MNYQASLLGVIIMAVSIHSITLSQNDDASAVISGIRSFGRELNQVVAKAKSGNYISSPLSIDVVLAMTSFGAGGNTKVQLRQALGLPADESVVKNGYRAVFNSLNNTQDAEVTLANKIYTAKDYNVKSDFTEVTKTPFGSATESLDFSNNEESAKTINDWVASQTNNQITELFEPQDLSSITAMVLANAVHFKGEWAAPFDKDYTQSRDFQVDGTTTKKVDMMVRRGDYNWGEISEANAKFIELPFKGGDISFFAFLPNDISGLASLEQNVDNIAPAQLEKPKTSIEFNMPKLHFESGFDLEQILTQLNITDMFNSKANFNGIDEHADIRVGKAVHKAIIEVNEIGSQVSGVSGLEAEATSISPKFALDRPFVFRFVHKALKLNIFTGRVVDPTQSI